MRHRTELHQIQRRSDAQSHLGVRAAAHAQGERNVFLHRQMREQRVALEHQADVALMHRGVRMIMAVDEKPAAGWFDQTADQMQQSGLPRP